jgi:dolichyl-phosphate beta-glucosyltransferase
MMSGLPQSKPLNRRPELSLLLIIPCYNESRRIGLPAFENALATNPEMSFLFVDDGSSDDTYNTLQAGAATHGRRWQVIRLEKNMGKAEAVRRGVMHAGREFLFLGYWDADLSTPVEEVSLMMPHLKAGKRLVMASRWKRLGATVKRNEVRHYFGRVFATLASNLLRLPVYDTQCGAKLFSAELRDLFSAPFYSRWIFDIELLARFRNKYGRDKALSEIFEHPVNSWIEKGDSRIKASHILRVPFDLLRIARKYNK